MGALRFFLALSVLGWHLRPAGATYLTLLDGGLAVLIFFVISGFYMSMVIDEKYSKLPQGHLRFFTNRFLRIFPIYLVVLVMAQATFSLDGGETIFTSSMGFGRWTHAALVGMNVVKFGQDYWQTVVEHVQTNMALGRTDALEAWTRTFMAPVAFEPTLTVLLVPQGWSLGSELTYYLLAPWIAASRWTRVVLLALASVAVRAAFFFTLGDAYMGSWRCKFFPSVLVFFLLGHLSYRLYRHVQDWRYRDRVAWLFVAVWLGLLLFAVCNEGLLVGHEYDSPEVWMFYLFASVSLPFLFLKTRDLRLDRWIGNLSYPIYIVHSLVILLIARHVDVTLGYQAEMIIAATLGISLLLVACVDHPLERLRRRVARSELDTAPPDAAEFWFLRALVSNVGGGTTRRGQWWFRVVLFAVLLGTAALCWREKSASDSVQDAYDSVGHLLARHNEMPNRAAFRDLFAERWQESLIEGDDTDRFVRHGPLRSFQLVFQYRTEEDGQVLHRWSLSSSSRLTNHPLREYEAHELLFLAGFFAAVAFVLIFPLLSLRKRTFAK